MAGNKKIPEETAPAQFFYDAAEAKKYTKQSHVKKVQSEMAARAVQMLMIPESDHVPLILDLGCGSGLSGAALTEAGYHWFGMDVAPEMLHLAKAETTDLIQMDIGNGVPFAANTFDGCISVSVLQWLCHSYATSQNPRWRLMKLFSDLYAVLRVGARAVFQWYPQNADQLTLVMDCAYKCGFKGGEVIDYPNSAKNKKHYLCLFAQAAENRSKVALPEPLLNEHEAVNLTRERAPKRLHERTKTIKKGSKQYVMMKKQRNRRLGKEGVPLDSKYTARKRKDRF
ncbi:S-adenosyl-L-methionine-dependent methyltransferase [Carpediemonas membranifera]|uniref:S-adenosyl-L-methionine-dependent methyltransferase n=1 Tax=Carpediemonas membranifera TaxID=201153 RepID=A0A8J6B0W0_9EUKA|nr:S-adenosyl-L-methionine-dependent methyltransferase [Carpediemonas membranifera]|eukprot:KAG9396030.1 S-adenosyl-L-methionine-dependent methyltransferase [Carpediemonas membranifera]